MKTQWQGRAWRLVAGAFFFVLFAAPQAAWANGGSQQGLEGAAMTGQELGQQLAGEWRVLSVKDASIPPGGMATLNFEPDRISGFAGCNSFAAPITYGTDGAIKLGDIRLTRMICSAEAMALEAQIKRALSRATGVRLDEGGRLVLLTFETETLRAERNPPPAMP